ncbi:MraY family glycosyltransferase [Limnobacter litoralis]|uniref:Glycosyl transferase n=1 Tax=Limnobacter litoralis TaxID=481366 RepID=A0ABQ5YSC1_9BURK|nr:glycosyltransferase [Limnobacter litoralis]GLR27029.1 glycosyl transferase [Limnobacter litoralis]
MSTGVQLYSQLAWPLIAAGSVSFVVCLLLVYTKQWHGRFTLDSSVGKQKVHASPTPRIGGVALAAGVLVFLLMNGKGTMASGAALVSTFKSVCVAALPAFFAGLFEDLTKKVSVLARLLATAFSGCLLVMLTGHWVSHVSLPGVDFLLSFYPVGLVFTAFAVAGIANSVNIIDGFNGLAGGVVILMLGTLAVIAGRVGDQVILPMAIVGIAVTLGFMLVNYPKGNIFLGDAGAYSLGFYVASLAILLAERNPGSVSPWAMLLVCGYPVIETLFSIYRRAFRKRKLSPGQPDALHLHSLAYKKLVSRRLMVGAPAWQRNAATSPFMWLYAAIPMLGAINWPESLFMVILWFSFSGVIYLRLYRKLLSLRASSLRLSTAG